MGVNFDEQTFQRQFETLLKYVDNKMLNYETSIKDNFNDNKNKDKTIYTTIIEKDKYLDYIDFLYPISKNSINKLTLSNILEKEYIDEVFIKLDYFSINDITDKLFKGRLGINDEYIEFDFKLVKMDYTKYFDIIYSNFLLNNISWVNINKVYINKMYGVKIENIDIEYLHFIMKNNDIDTEILVEYDFEDFVDYIVYNILLVWNIKKETLISDKLIIPNEYDLIYKYDFEINDKDMYLLNDKEKYIFGVINKKEKMEILSKYNNKKIWDFNILKKVDEKYIKDIKYPLISNKISSEEYIFYESNNNIIELFNRYNLNDKLEIVDIELGDKDYRALLIGENLDYRKYLKIYIKIKEYDYKIYDYIEFLILEFNKRIKYFNIQMIEVNNET